MSKLSVCSSPQCSEKFTPSRNSKGLYCSRSCAATTNNRKYPKRGTGIRLKCKNCNNICKTKQNTYCSLTCCHQYKNKEYIKRWLTGSETGITPQGILVACVRRYLLYKAQYTCSECNWSKVSSTTKKVPVQVDHINGNYKNCYPSNLRVLCPNCHSLTPTFGALNKGNGREYRYNAS